MTDLVKHSAAWMARAVQAREVSAAELVDAHATRIEGRNAEVNAERSAPTSRPDAP